MDVPAWALRGLVVDFTNAFVSECDARARAFLCADGYPNELTTDMRVRDPIGLPHAHVYAASVSCPTFPAAGFRLVADAPDGQGLLIWNAVAAITACRPSFFILEQVPGLMTAHEGSLFVEALASLQCGGAYSIWHANVCTSKNGLPQRRRRL